MITYMEWISEYAKKYDPERIATFTSGPVSYTHLDVYKRQAEGMGGAAYTNRRIQQSAVGHQCAQPRFPELLPGGERTAGKRAAGAHPPGKYEQGTEIHHILCLS